MENGYTIDLSSDAAEKIADQLWVLVKAGPKTYDCSKYLTGGFKYVCKVELTRSFRRLNKWYSESEFSDICDIFKSGQFKFRQRIDLKATMYLVDPLDRMDSDGNVKLLEDSTLEYSFYIDHSNRAELAIGLKLYDYTSRNTDLCVSSVIDRDDREMKIRAMIIAQLGVDAKDAIDQEVKKITDIFSKVKI